MRVLIVGGAGYIGSVVADLLWRQGHEVTVLDLLIFGKESLRSLVGKDGFRLVQGDLRDDDTLLNVIPGHEAVCLFAAIVGEPACNRDERLAFETNRHGAVKTLNAAQRCGVERFVFASTCSNYGISSPGTVATERSPLNPISVYSRSKVAAEEAILATAKPSFCPTVLRLSTAFGVSPRMRFDLLVSDFTLAAFRDRRIVIFGESFWRPFVHVRDIAEATRIVLTSPREIVCGEVFNVGANENNVQKGQLGLMVQSEIPDTTLQYVHSGEDLRSYRVDFSKLSEALHVHPAWTIPQGIQEVHAGLRTHYWPDLNDPRYYNSPPEP